MVRRHSLCSVLAVLLCALPAAAFAQQETATIAGTITDSTGAVVPHAVVVVTNVQTGITVRTAATESGSLPRSQPSTRRLLGGGREQGLPENGAHGRDAAGRTGGAHRCHAANRRAHRSRRSRRRDAAARHADLVPGFGHRSEEDRRTAAQRPGLQPAGAALARRAPRHSPPGQRQLQGRAQREREPHLQQRVPARRRGQHLLLEFLPR